MNYHAFFDQLQSRYHLEELLLYLERHPGDFDNIFSLVFETEEKIAWRVLWAVEKVSQRNPEWFDHIKIDRVTEMVLTTRHQGLHRIGLSILNSFPAPNPLDVNMLNALYEWMLSPQYSIGVQSLAMKLLHKYASTHEDLLQEFIITIKQADEILCSPAFIASRRQILKRYRLHGVKK